MYALALELRHYAYISSNVLMHASVIKHATIAPKAMYSYVCV